jgi:hypothetical protein
MSTAQAKFAQRAVRHEFDNGIWEMVGGAMLVLFGLILAPVGVLPPRMPWIGLWTISALAVLFGGIFGGLRAARGLKARWVYPRAGYVSSRKPLDGPRKSRLLWISVAIVSVVGAVGPPLRSAISSFSGVIVIYAALTALGLVLFAARTGLSRYLTLSAIAFAAGLGLAYAPLGDMAKLALGPIIIGAILLASGRIALRRFIKRHEEIAL